MFCPYCGKEINDGYKHCPECGGVLYYSTAEDYNKPKVRPSSYRALVIISMVVGVLLGFGFPFSIPALVYSIGVDSAWEEHRYQLAQEKSNKAKNWSVISLCISVGIWLFILFWLGTILY